MNGLDIGGFGVLVTVLLVLGGIAVIAIPVGFVLMLRPRSRAKQREAQGSEPPPMVGENRPIMSDVMAGMMGVAIGARQQILDTYGPTLQDQNTRTAQISAPGIQIQAEAVRRGLLDQPASAYCSSCGATIDEGARFCKMCGQNLQ